MPMSLKEQIPYFLWSISLWSPLPKRKEDLAKRTPDTYLEQGETSSTPHGRVRRGSSSSRKAGCKSTS